MDYSGLDAEMVRRARPHSILYPAAHDGCTGTHEGAMGGATHPPSKPAAWADTVIMVRGYVC